MKKLSLILFACVLFTQDDFDFRNAKWSFTRLEVKKSEKAELFKDTEQLIVYKDAYSGFPVGIQYVFDNNRLYRCLYVFSQEHANKNDYIGDLKAIKENLLEQYGTPQSEKVIWKNNLYKDDPENHGLAISIGHLVFFTQWETERTRVILLMNGVDYNVRCLIEYLDKSYQPKQK